MARRARAGGPAEVELPVVHLARDWPPAVVAQRLADGTWVRVRRGAYVEAPVGLDRFAVARRAALARVVAVRATLAAGVLSHTSAALLWGLPLLVPPDRVHVVGAWSGNGRSSRDVVRHVVRLDEADVARRAGLPTTTLARTVVDCATTLGVAGGVVRAPRRPAARSPDTPDAGPGRHARG